MQQQITIDKQIFNVLDVKEKVTIADSFVVRSNKIGTGNGEAKLYVGNESDELRNFFGIRPFLLNCFLLKKDLIKYLNDTMDFVGVISKDLFQKEVYYVMTLDDSKYKNIKDLDGKSIGIYSSKNGEEAIKLLDKKIKSNITTKNEQTTNTDLSFKFKYLLA